MNFKQIISTIVSLLNKKPADVSTESTPEPQPTVVSEKKIEKVVEKKIVNKEINMGYTFGKRSRERLDTCHPDMIAICEEVVKIYDFSVLEGLRTAEKQAEYFETGRSKLDGVKKKSKHQDDGSGKSRAVDLIPYKKGTNAFSGAQKDLKRFYYLAGLMKMSAQKLLSEGKINHTIRWGGDWDSDDIYTDQNFDDLPHFELKSL